MAVSIPRTLCYSYRCGHVCVRPSIFHKPVPYRMETANKIDLVFAMHKIFFRHILHSCTPKNKGISICNFVPNFGLKSFANRQGTLTVVSVVKLVRQKWTLGVIKWRSKL